MWGYYSYLSGKWCGFDQGHSMEVVRSGQAADIYIQDHDISRVGFIWILNTKKLGKNWEGHCQAVEGQDVIPTA